MAKKRGRPTKKVKGLELQALLKEHTPVIQFRDHHGLDFRKQHAVRLRMSHWASDCFEIVERSEFNQFKAMCEKLCLPVIDLDEQDLDIECPWCEKSRPNTSGTCPHCHRFPNKR